tara:strand:- start:231 stop:395 length:165 start_codon:yes stop_codon:yes gene_type:complete
VWAWVRASARDGIVVHLGGEIEEHELLEASARDDARALGVGRERHRLRRPRLGR